MSEVTISDNGIGMSYEPNTTGRDRRKTTSQTQKCRKGIGKFSSFGIAKEIEIESVKDGEVSRL